MDIMLFQGFMDEEDEVCEDEDVDEDSDSQSDSDRGELCFCCVAVCMIRSAIWTLRNVRDVGTGTCKCRCCVREV